MDSEDEDDRPGRATQPEPPTPLTEERIPDAVVPPAPTLDKPAKKGKKEEKKQRKLLKDAHRPMDSWERYRALTDAFDDALELVDLADHKARFALVIMGALNALLFVLGSRTTLFDAIPTWLAVYMGIYTFTALYFFLQAIESLRPRKSQPNVQYRGDADLEDYPVGLRFFVDVLRRDVEAYRRAWREVRIGQLNAEVAIQIHALANINRAKYAALNRLYLGLQIMTVMAALLLAASAWVLVKGRTKQDAKVRAGWGAAADAQRVGHTGSKEPSGVAFDERANRLYLVGDEGSLVHLDAEGRKLAEDRVEAQVEDVAVHPPSGRLVLLSEAKSELIVFDPVAHRETARFRIDGRAVLGEQPPIDRNQGFEGLAFRPEAGRPGGGVFYLTHQRAPATVVALAFDPAGPPATLGSDAVLARWPMPKFEDLTAVTYAPTLDRLLVVADAKDRLLVLRLDGTLEADLEIPGKQQEGIALDAAGTLWIADDLDKSLLRMPGALAALERRLRGTAADEAGSPPAGTPRDDRLRLSF